MCVEPPYYYFGILQFTDLQIENGILQVFQLFLSKNLILLFQPKSL